MSLYFFILPQSAKSLYNLDPGVHVQAGGSRVSEVINFGEERLRRD